MRYSYTALLFIIVLVLVNRSRADDCGTFDHQDFRSIVMINEEGEPDLWSFDQATDLSFCISKVFSTNYENVEGAVRTAALEWMKHGNFDFKLADDLSCDNKSRQVLFRIVPTSRQAKFKARAFFPGSEPQKRKIQINRRFADSDAYEMQRLMLHELGHVLGLRHEHIHADAGGDCLELGDFDPVTDYDPASIMHYPSCGPKKLQNFVLSDLDKAGISTLYPY